MRLKVGKGEIGVDRTGRGVPLVLLHAFPFDRRMWSAASLELSSDAQVIAIDFPGLGESSAPAAPLTPTIDGAGDAIAVVLDALGIERAVVAGLSLGGYVALSFAARHRQRLAGLVLAGTRAEADTPEQQAGRDASIARVVQKGTAEFLRELLPKLFGPSPGRAREPAAAIAGLQSPMGIASALAAMRERTDRSALLPSLDVPTAVIVGENDGIATPASMKKMADAIAGASFTVVPRAGHLVALEEQAAFSSAVRALLDRVRPALK